MEGILTALEEIYEDDHDEEFSGEREDLLSMVLGMDDTEEVLWELTEWDGKDDFSLYSPEGGFKVEKV